MSGGSVPGEDGGKPQSQQSSTFEKAVHAPIGVRLCSDSENRDPRRVWDILHPELRIVRYQPLRRSGEQRNITVLRQQR